MQTGPPHHLVVAATLFFFIRMFFIRREFLFYTALILLPLLMEFVQPFLPFNFSFEVGDIVWNYIGAAIGISAYMVFSLKIRPALRLK